MIDPLELVHLWFSAGNDSDEAVGLAREFMASTGREDWGLWDVEFHEDPVYDADAWEVSFCPPMEMTQKAWDALFDDIVDGDTSQ